MEYNPYITNESERKTGKHFTNEDQGAIQAIHEKAGLQQSENRRVSELLSHHSFQ